MEGVEGIPPPPGPLPPRVFAAGEEPTGVRVTPYHKANGIRQIISALHPDEVEAIRASPFGKLIDIAEKPSFSGRFGRYIISRQLKVSKKHEVWFLFAGKPIRFSIREFAIVTGLNCSKFPQRSKKRSSKNSICEKPYWIDLFGSLKDITVGAVVRMLQKKTVVDTEVRIKYAYLALLSAVLLPTTHTPRISEQFAEKIKDLDVFFEWPWGRVAFEMLITSIKERKELSLTQNTIALKGFVLALQLVMIECVPALTEVVQDGSSSGSEGEDDNIDSDKGYRKSISPGHARDIDAAGKAQVQSIIVDGRGGSNDEHDYEWSDDEEDVGVANMVKLIGEQYPFTADLFVGGATKADIARLREEANADLVNRKSAKSRSTSSSSAQIGVDTNCVAAVVREKLQDDFQLVHRNLATMQESISGFSTTILTNFGELFSMVDNCLARVTTLSAEFVNFRASVPGHFTPSTPRPPPSSDAGTQTDPDASHIIAEAMDFANQSTNKAVHVDSVRMETTNTITTTADHSGPADAAEPEAEQLRPSNQVNTSPDPTMVFPNPSFSLGLTQDARVEDAAKDKPNETTGPEIEEDHQVAGKGDDALLGCRRGKRQKVPTKSLMGEYECDKSFLNRERDAFAYAIYKGGHIEYASKFSALLEKMSTPFSMETDWGVIESTELYEIVERSSQLKSKMMDVLMFHTRTLLRSQSGHLQQPGFVFMDTQFVARFIKMYTKFSKVTKKETLKFSEDVVQCIQNTQLKTEPERFYLPFFVDKKYWVGICVDCSTWIVTVLDCNYGLRTDYMMNKEVRPIAIMFPYLLKQAGRQLGPRDCKAMAIERPRSIPQQKVATHSGVTSVLFTQAHAVGGIDACKCITQDALDSYVERIVVSLYEASVGPI